MYGKTYFKQSKHVFSGNKTFHQRFGANFKNPFLQNFAVNFLLFSFFKLFWTKIFKKHILTSFWSAQHPNAGQNVKQLCQGKANVIFLVNTLDSLFGTLYFRQITFTPNNVNPYDRFLRRWIIQVHITIWKLFAICLLFRVK